jgi:hypothetical protein
MAPINYFKRFAPVNEDTSLPVPRVVEAESPNDTLTIVAGKGLVVTSDVTTDTIKVDIAPAPPAPPTPEYVKASDVSTVGSAVMRVADKLAFKKIIQEALAVPDPPPPVPDPIPDPPPVVVDPPPVSDGRVPATAADLELVGHAAFPDQTYANWNLGMRMVTKADGTKERRFLMYQFGNQDIVEYRLGGPLKLATGHYTRHEDVPAAVEVRRWKGPSWQTKARMIAATYPNAISSRQATEIFSGNGAWPASFYFDKRSGLLWNTWQPAYPGGSIVWPAYGAVRLVDAESTENGGTGIVSDANVFGPYYMTSRNTNDYKSGACGIIPIPAHRQSALGGKFLIAGYHCANIGAEGARGVSLWVVKDLPLTPPEPGSILFPDAVHIYDTGSHLGDLPGAARVFPYSMKTPNVVQQTIGHASQGGQFERVEKGVSLTGRSGDSVPLGVDDALIQHDYGKIDVVCVTMHTPASGGTFVPEVKMGGIWTIPGGWQMAAGKADLSERENVFYWPQLAIDDPGSTAVRLRRTAAGLFGGVIEAIVTTTSIEGPVNYGDRPDGKGGLTTIAAAKYDAENFGYSYENFPWGMCVAYSARVEAAFGYMPIATGRLWYGAAPMWGKPRGGDGVPRKVRFCLENPSYGNGGKTEGPRHPFGFTFDLNQLAEAAAGLRPRNASGLQPATYFDMVKALSGLIVPSKVPYADDPHFGMPTFNNYGASNSVTFDEDTQEMFVLMSNGTVWQPNTLMAVIKVR